MKRECLREKWPKRKRKWSYFKDKSNVYNQHVKT